MGTMEKVITLLICLWLAITAVFVFNLFYEARASDVQATTAQWTDDDDTVITFQDIKPEDQVFVISWGDDRSVSLKGDGTIEYLGEYNPTEAAKVFWEAVAKQRCL